MVDTVVRSFLGEWGQTLLDGYRQYSLWINSIILLYFLALLVSQRNYRQTLSDLLEAIEKNLPGQFQKKNSQDIAKLLKKKEIPWEAGLRRSQWPLIASPRQLIPRIKNEQALRKLYPIESLAIHLANRAEANTNKSQP
jgi:hypothetical protein